MTWHVLDTWPENFEPVARGVLTCVVRVFDRDFVVGDHLVLVERVGMLDKPAGRRLVLEVTHILRGMLGIAETFGVMSVRKRRVLHCAACRVMFVGPEKEQCPRCWRAAYWSPEPTSGFRFWNEEEHR